MHTWKEATQLLLCASDQKLHHLHVLHVYLYYHIGYTVYLNLHILLYIHIYGINVDMKIV